MNRQQTLEAALAAVTKRPKAYGPPEQNFDRIANRWNAHLANRYAVWSDEFELDATDVAVMCADIKLARLEETPDHQDSWTDLAGYAACGAEVSTDVAEVTTDGAQSAADFYASQSKKQAGLEAARNAPKRPLRIGDRVRVMRALDGVKASKGLYATVDQVTPDFIFVKFDKPIPDDSGLFSEKWCAQYYLLEPTGFALGDRVIYEGNSPLHVMRINSFFGETARGYCSCGVPDEYALSTLKHALDDTAQAKVEGRA